MTTRVNIVYVRGTVRRLLPFLDSIITETTLDLNLAVNGCTDDEQRLLAAVANNHPDRAAVTMLSSERVLRHGEALDRLLAEEPSPHFCVLDSDVFATGPVALAELLPTSNQAAVCSCVPIWQVASDTEMPAGFKDGNGRFIRTAGSHFLGCSYAAAYDTAALRQTIQHWNISMRHYVWKDIPTAVQTELRQRDLELQNYDTAKLANFLLQVRDRTMEFVEIPNLVHLGSQSSSGSGPRMSGAHIKDTVSRYLVQSTPWALRFVLRARGRSALESANIVDFRRRRAEAMEVVRHLSTGTLSPADAPSWLADPETFAAMSRILRATDGPQRERPVADVLD